MARATVKDEDFGWRRIESELKKLDGLEVAVGFQEGSETKKEVKGQREKQGGISMPQIAAENEFGTKTTPARPFMSTAFDENKVKLNQDLIKLYDKITQGRITATKALNIIGVELVGMIQQKIRQIQTPPNAPFTIKQKGSSKPLIDFGQMIQSVTSKVRKKT